MRSFKSIFAVISFALCLTIQAGLKVGYADFTARGSCPTFTESASHGYTIIIVSFGVVNGSLVSLPDSYLGPYHNMNELKTDMAAAKKAYPDLKVFLSFGGESNTWKPGSATAVDVGNALTKFATENSFDGIDFDIEVPQDGTYLSSVITQVKTAAPELYVSIAPQGVPDYTKTISGNNYSGAGFVTAGWYYDYNKAIESGKIDYIFVQLYNNTWYQLNGKVETSASFIPEFMSAPKNVTIPAGTDLIPGLPATKSAGNGCTGNDTDANIKKALSPYEGTMTWSINADKANNWNFVTNVMP